MSKRLHSATTASNLEKRNFRRWLSNLIQRPFKELAGYTALDNYEQLGVDGIVALLRHNRSSLGIDPDSRTITETIRSEYESSLEKLSELNGEISAAEPELESAVFDLYEMTETQRNTIDVEYES